MKKQVLILIIIITFFSGKHLVCQDNINIKELFPDNYFFKGWAMKDSIAIYNGENLYYYIDGGADIYLEYGFIEAASSKYQNDSGTVIHLEIYKMASDSAAFGIFTLNSSEKGIPVNVGDKAIQYDNYLDLWKGSYFIRCSRQKTESNIMDKLELFAGFVNDKIAVSGNEPKITNLFRNVSMEVTNVKYITGITGLGNVYNFGHGAIAGFTEGLIGYSDDKMLFIFRYANDHKCREWFASAKGKMQMNQKFSDYLPVENGFTIKHKEGINFCFVQNKQLILIIKGMEWEEAQPVLDQIRKNLND